MDTNVPTENTTTKDAPEKEGSNKGGKGARSRRRDARRKDQNVNKDKNIKASADLELGLTDSSELKTLEPQFSLRPGGVRISLLGTFETTNLMLKRMTAIAQRPLAILLNRPENVSAYRKVAGYIATARIAAAQTAVSYAVGETLDLVGVVTSDEFRMIDGRSGILPNFLAWTLANIGNFKIDGCENVPIISHPAAGDATIDDVYTGNYYAIARFVQAGPPQPADLVDIRRLTHILPEFNLTAAGNWTVATQQYWLDATPTANDWTAFTTINAALREQGLTVDGFKVTTATGSPTQTLRFPRLDPSTTTTAYYCLVPLTASTIRSGLVLRLGLDEKRPERTRFMGDPTTAILNGYDTPIVYIQAQLSMMSKTEIKS